MKDRLNELIEKKNLTATKFATLIDANPSAISHLLKGRNKPGYDLLVNIAKAFPDVSMEWLLTGKGNMIVSKEAVNAPDRQNKLSSTVVSEPFPVQEMKQSNTPIVPPDVLPPAHPDKKLKRIILFFSDGSFEDYNRD